MMLLVTRDSPTLLPSEWYTSVSLSHSLLFLPCFFFLRSCRPARFGIPLLAVSSAHTMASNNKLDVVGSTPAEHRWRRNTHLHARLDSVQIIEKQLILIYNSLPLERLLGCESATTKITTRRVGRQEPSRPLREPPLQPLWSLSQTRGGQSLPSKASSSPLPDILEKIGTAMSVTQRAQKPPKPSRLCQTHCIYHSWSKPDDLLPTASTL